MTKPATITNNQGRKKNARRLNFCHPPLVIVTKPGRAGLATGVILAFDSVILS
jgi:hypothetical protein